MKKANCWGCDRKNIRTAPQGKGLCQTCARRIVMGQPLKKPLQRSNLLVVYKINRPKQIQAEIDRRIEIYAKRAEEGKDLFNPPI